MATAFYVVRVENQWGESMEFEHDYEFDLEEWDGVPFDPTDPDVQREIYKEIMDNLYVDIDFDRLED